MKRKHNRLTVNDVFSASACFLIIAAIYVYTIVIFLLFFSTQEEINFSSIITLFLFLLVVGFIFLAFIDIKINSVQEGLEKIFSATEFVDTEINRRAERVALIFVTTVFVMIALLLLLFVSNKVGGAIVFLTVVFMVALHIALLNNTLEIVKRIVAYLLQNKKSKEERMKCSADYGVIIQYLRIREEILADIDENELVHKQLPNPSRSNLDVVEAILQKHSVIISYLETLYSEGEPLARKEYIIAVLNIIDNDIVEGLGELNDLGRRRQEEILKWFIGGRNNDDF